MRNKYFYPIFKLKTKSWIRYWLLKKTEFKGKLSEILSGFTFNLQNTLRQKFVKFEIQGHSIQDGTPSPENEVPILSAGENVNLFDKDAEPISTNSISKTILDTGIRLTNTRTWATEGINTSARFKIMDLKGYEGKSITIKTHAKASSNNYAFLYFRIGDNDANFINDYQLVSSDTTLDGVLKVTLNVPSTLDATYHYLYLTIYGTRMASSITAGDYIDYTDLKIEQGSIATPYSPYGMGSITEKITNGDNTEEQTYTIYTQQPFRSIGDVRDCFVKKSDGWYERHYIKRLVFDGTENWDLSINGNFFKLLNTDIPVVASSYEIPLALSNYYIATSYNKINNAIVDYGFGFGSNTHRIDIRNKDITNLSDFKTWLSAHNVEVEFIAIEPLDLPCTPEQTNILENIPSTFSGQTNVFSEDEVKAYLKIQYWESDTNG